MENIILDGNVTAHINDRTASGQPVSHSMLVTLAGTFMTQPEIFEKTEEAIDEFCAVHNIIPSTMYMKLHVFKDHVVVLLHC